VRAGLRAGLTGRHPLAVNPRGCRPLFTHSMPDPRIEANDSRAYSAPFCADSPSHIVHSPRVPHSPRIAPIWRIRRGGELSVQRLNTRCKPACKQDGVQVRSDSPMGLRRGVAGFLIRMSQVRVLPGVLSPGRPPSFSRGRDPRAATRLGHLRRRGRTSPPRHRRRTGSGRGSRGRRSPGSRRPGGGPSRSPRAAAGEVPAPCPATRC
jgi:hypothetical protein